MSIINEALKKAGKQQDFLKTEAKRFISRRWLIYIGSGVICVLGIILAVTYLKPVAFDSIFAPEVSAPELVSKPQAARNTFQLKEVEIEVPKSPTPDFNLKGILYDQQKPMAIINNRIVEEGAVVGGAQILEIQPELVRLSREGEEFELKIK